MDLVFTPLETWLMFGWFFFILYKLVKKVGQVLDTKPQFGIIDI